MPGPEMKVYQNREGAKRKTFQERERKRDRGRNEGQGGEK